MVTITLLKWVYILYSFNTMSRTFRHVIKRRCLDPSVLKTNDQHTEDYL